jgi:hypothetical protein
MRLKNKKAWNEYVRKNDDSYGKCCVDVARRVMEILDEGKDFDTYKVICQADDDIKTGGITGFMAGCVATIVSQCHVRGDEFRKKWNLDNHIVKVGEKANEKGMY